MSKKFLVGVANIYAYNKSTSDLLFASKTMLDTAIEVSTSNQEISGGQGNALQYIYFHSPRLNLTLTDTQFNLGMVAANVGSVIKTSNNVWTEESVVITSNAGTVLKDPLKTPDSNSTIYGWVTDANGNTQRVTFTGKNFTTVGLSDQTVCVRYYALDSGSRQVDIPANFIPANVRLVMECQLASSNQSSGAGSSIIGKVQFEINSAQLSGAQSIAMSSSGVANTPLSAMALADDSGIAGCSASGSGLYGKITEIIYDAKWYDNLTAITAVPDPVSLSGSKTTEQLQVWAIPMNGAAFIVPDYSELTFVSGTPATATVDASGLITRVATGSTVITVSITAKPEYDTTVNVVSA